MKAIWTMGLLAALAFSAHGQEMARNYDFSSPSEMRVSTVVLVKDAGQRTYVYSPLPKSRKGAFQARDLSTMSSLPWRRKGSRVEITLPGPRSTASEVRLQIEETVSSDSRDYSASLDPGRYTFTLPKNYALTSCSLPAQILVRDGRLSAGIIVQTGPALFHLSMAPSIPLDDAPAKATLRSDDPGVITYTLQEPSTHQIRLWLEMYVNTQGQKHFFSQLRPADNVAPTSTLDVDTGAALPTRIISGSDANRMGDMPTPFPESASILVADLDRNVPVNGSIRIRSFQTATDPGGYRLLDANDFRLDRFVGRTRSRYVLPSGWQLAFTDQPAIISRDDQGRVVLDYVARGKGGSPLVILGQRASR